VSAPVRLSARQRKEIDDFGCELSARVANGRPFVCVISNDTELRNLNRSFLNHDYATDVLSFPSSDTQQGLGDIAISLDRARAQAEVLQHDMIAEIKLLMLHGVLHLLGMDHEADSGEMAREERRLRSRFGLPAGLIARSRRGAA
jgi:probable rRNA maturation factor